MSSVVATLMDTGGTLTNIQDEIHLCATNMKWRKASTHVDGSGLENGVDTRGFHKRRGWLVRNGLQGKAGLMKAAVAGGLWPAASLGAADDRHDGLCQRCLAEGSEVEETMLHRVWQCSYDPTSGIIRRARKRKSSKMMTLRGFDEPSRKTRWWHRAGSKLCGNCVISTHVASTNLPHAFFSLSLCRLSVLSVCLCVSIQDVSMCAVKMSPRRSL